MKEYLIYETIDETRLGHGEIIDDVIETSVQSNLLIYDFYDHLSPFPQKRLILRLTTIIRLGDGEIIDDVIGYVIGKSVQSNLLIYDFYNHSRQENTIEI